MRLTTFLIVHVKGLASSTSGGCTRSAFEAASLSGAIRIIIGYTTAMAWALTQSGFSS